jgi:hypothetical protein
MKIGPALLLCLALCTACDGPGQHPAPSASAAETKLDSTFVVAVQGADGKPRAGVGLRVLSGRAQPAFTKTDDRGEARFDVAGVVQVIVDDPAHPPVTAYANPAPAEVAREAITVPDAVTLDGSVVDAAGKPLADAQIEILSRGMVVPPRTKTDAEGRFRALLNAGSWRIKAAKPGRSDTWVTAEIPAGQARATVTIRVVDAASLVVTTDCAAKGCAKGCEGAEVNVSVANSGASQYLDARGGASFANLPVGEAKVYVRHDEDPRHPLYGEANVTLAPGATASASVTVKTLDASAQVSGKLLERGGEPAARVPGTALVVEARCGVFHRRMTVSAADGSFSMGDLLPGECQFSGLRVDPADPMSGANGMRPVTKVVAPASGVTIPISDFTGRGPKAPP